MKFVCFSCGKEVERGPGPVGRSEECPHCHTDLHCCKNCQHYDPKAYNECREPVAEVVREKDRSNFCDHFTPGGKTNTGPGKDALLSAAEALFKKK